MITELKSNQFKCSGIKAPSVEDFQDVSRMPAESLCAKPASLVVRGFMDEYYIKFLCVECAQMFSDSCFRG